MLEFIFVGFEVLNDYLKFNFYEIDKDDELDVSISFVSLF
jgi:hypothetical protein